MVDTGFQSRQRSQSVFLGTVAGGASATEKTVLALPTQVGEIHRGAAVVSADMAAGTDLAFRLTGFMRFPPVPNQDPTMGGFFNIDVGMRANVPSLMLMGNATYRRFKTYHWVNAISMDFGSFAATNLQLVAYFVFGFYDLTEA